MKWGNSNRGHRFPLALIAVVAIFAFAGTAVAAVGASTLLSTGDDAAATAHGAQLGTLSASTPNGREDESGSAPDTISSPPEGTEAADTPGTNVVNTTSSSKLPFTGLLAIPVLLAGVGLLGAGLVLRRRSVQTAAAS